MDISDLKKTLAGLCIASLVSGAGLAYASDGSPSGAGGTDQKKEAGKAG
jgi:radical SAM modification target selenobiotic family peptide